MEYAVLITIGISFILAILIGPLFIPFLRKLKFGQQVRTDGPQAHLKKQGTPTMGGLIILLAFTIAVLPFVEHNLDIAILFIATLGYGLIGFLDDYIKIVFKRSLGLTAWQKIAGQTIISVIICILLVLQEHSTKITIPLTDYQLSLGWFYYLFVVLVMIGGSNAVNFTDGLDGLLAGTSAIAFGAYAILALYYSQADIAVFCAGMIGAVLGFLIFNKHPARVFMGDTGSLAIGGGIVAVSVLTKLELLLAVIGGVFLIEALSVFIQVTSFKTRGKRVFKMSPIHHHFELVGWSEWRVVLTFWLAGLLFAIVGLFLSGVR